MYKYGVEGEQTFIYEREEGGRQLDQSVVLVLLIVVLG